MSTVYDLDSVEDFPGVFTGIGGGMVAVTAGLCGVSITNAKCVVLSGIADLARGLRLTQPLGSGGVQINLDD